MPRAPSDTQSSPPAQFVHTLLLARDPVALALMERLCLFCPDVSAGKLAAVANGAGNRTVRRSTILAPFSPGSRWRSRNELERSAGRLS
jgi:hypothetical protein